MKVRCACGREIASRVFKQHGRKCDAMLREWADQGHSMELLDERSPERKTKNPISTTERWSPR